MQKIKPIKNIYIYVISLIGFVVAGIFAIGFSSGQLVNYFLQDALTAFLVADIIRSFLIFLFVFFSSKYVFKIDLKLLFKKTLAFRNFKIGVVMGALMILLCFVLLIFTNAIEWRMPDSFNEFYFRIFIVVVTSLTTSFWEELIMRGFFLNALLQRLSQKKAVFISASLFGVAHLLGPSPSILTVLSTLLAGLLLGLVFVHSRTIWLCLGLHFSWNCFQYLIFSKKIFSVKFLNSFFAGTSSLEEGFVAMAVTFISILFVIYYKVGKNESDDLLIN